MTKHLVSKELKDDNTNSEVVISLIWVPRIIAGINNYKIQILPVNTNYVLTRIPTLL